MTQYDDKNRGVLFTNDRKSHDAQPDFKGKLNVEGVERCISGWWKTPTRGGAQFLSLSLGEPVEAQQNSRPPAPAQRPQGNRPPPSRNEGYGDYDSRSDYNR